MPRAILHVDMDAFFASVEQLDNPDLRGKPVLVGGTSKRGVISAASYEARAFGCRSAMPTAVAKRLCPHAIVVKTRGRRYRELSDQVFAIFDDFTPLVQPLSIDEAFLDVTGSERLLGPALGIATTIRARIKAETGLTASVGLAPNKFLAKLASDLKKPDALVVIDPDRIQETLDPLPVTVIFGIGKAAAQRLERLGVRTIAQLRQLEPRTLKATFGSWGERVGQLARGEDDRPVVPDHAAKSVGHETTFGENLTTPDEVRAVLLQLTEDTAWRLRKKDRRARTITCKIRFGDFETITRATTLDTATNTTAELWAAAAEVFDAWAAKSFQPVRLIGIQASALTETAETQPGLFPDPAHERQQALDKASDAVAAKFGKGSIRRARTLPDDPDRG
ncbi:MAG: DNA polymerase IV [Phycisphaerales bacterium]|nr:DNA polymerase IV [Phycisphaerales bacterium]